VERIEFGEGGDEWEWRREVRCILGYNYGGYGLVNFGGTDVRSWSVMLQGNI